MSVVTLITPTGARPEAFALCERWMQMQTYKRSLEWLVVDDYDKEPTKLNYGQKKIAAPKQWTPDINTQRFNMDALMEHIKGEYIFIIEDDEYYSPDYIDVMMGMLGKVDIVGLSNSRYYHVGISGYKNMQNFKHASLCQTAMRRSVLPLLYRAVHSGHYYFDIELWKMAVESEVKLALLSNSSISIGIKGMPGRYGLGAGHDRVGYQADKGHKVLKDWVGRDYIHYEKYLK